MEVYSMARQFNAEPKDVIKIIRDETARDALQFRTPQESGCFHLRRGGKGRK